MVKKLERKIKVSPKVKPLPFKERKAPKIIEGDKYYVCLGNNNVYLCTLVEKKHGLDWTEVVIEIPMKPLSKKGFIDVNGKRSHNWNSSHALDSKEIGSTPEEAVKNTVE